MSLLFISSEFSRVGSSFLETLVAVSIARARVFVVNSFGQLSGHSVRIKQLRRMIVHDGQADLHSRNLRHGLEWEQAPSEMANHKLYLKRM